MPSLVLICGGTASGKTSLARQLVQDLGEDRCVVLSEDNYYRPELRAMLDRGEPVNFDDVATKDYELLVEQVGQLLAGETIAQPQYDFATHSRRDVTESVAPADFLLLEGLHVLYSDALRRLATRTIYIDVPADLRLARRVRRDIDEREREPHDIIRQYLHEVRPMHLTYTESHRDTADVVLHDDHPERLPIKKWSADIASDLLEQD